ncbi:hypothetical protein IEN91_04410 [Bacillus velezensis]|uniref:hypothetical protein n=1 Tax=Bacillus velezensis TaxID=492670 RepID=UPI0018C7F853|nr:hypothetical protein [Bacillus velezensis]QPK89697.1 hypothetical protein IEN91_04410 [Bacillus velezensis]
MDKKQKVINAYADGSPLSVISTSFNITYDEVITILREFKEESRHKKTFTDEFKIIIAERDMNGGKDVTRSSIAKELAINSNTVKKSCEQFGMALKEARATSENEFVHIEGTFDLSTCPSCQDRRVNKVDEDTIYCMSCGNEHIIKENHALRVAWEHLEE